MYSSVVERLTFNQKVLGSTPNTSTCPQKGEKVEEITVRSNMQKNRLKAHYEAVVRYDSMIQLPLINAAEIPEVSHIVLNKGLGSKAVLDRKLILETLLALEIISGQRPYITEAKKSIDKFKLRKGMPTGCKVTLRGTNAYLFLDRLILRILTPTVLESIIKKKS